MQIYEDEFIRIFMDTGTVDFVQLEQGGGNSTKIQKEQRLGKDGRIKLDF